MRRRGPALLVLPSVLAVVATSPVMLIAALRFVRPTEMVVRLGGK